MTHLHIRDKQDGIILERHAVDAHEIVANGKGRYEIVGRVPPSQPGTTTAVLDNDPPTEVARKVLAAAGVQPQQPEGESNEVADQDVHGNALTDAGREAELAASEEDDSDEDAEAAPASEPAVKKTRGKKAAAPASE